MIAIFIIITLLIVTTIVVLYLLQRKSIKMLHDKILDLQSACGYLRADVNGLSVGSATNNDIVGKHGEQIRFLNEHMQNAEFALETLGNNLTALEEKRYPEHKKYTDDFKMDCINYIKSNNLSCEAASEKLGVPARTLRSWVKAINDLL